MATVSKDIYVRVLTYDPLQDKLIPVPNADLLIEDDGWLWDDDLSKKPDPTDVKGETKVNISYEDSKEDSLNPFITISLPEANRKVPSGKPADQQMTLPGEWTTKHSKKHRLTKIGQYTNPSKPLIVYVGLPANLWVSYTDFHSSGKRNPIALPENTARVHLADYDSFLGIDCLAADDVLKGFGVNPQGTKIIAVGETPEYPYLNTWPTTPSAVNPQPVDPKAWIDPPDAPIASLGGGSFKNVGPMAVDHHGFVFMIDGNVVRRFYPDGTLCETITETAPGKTFKNPKGLAVDQYRNLFVSDTDNHRIAIFNLKNKKGEDGIYAPSNPVQYGGTKGHLSHQLDSPGGISVVPCPITDDDEFLAIADTNNKRVIVLRIDVDAKACSNRAVISPDVKFIYFTQFGAPASGSAAAAGNRVAGELWNPVDVASDILGRLYVCDDTWHRISKWQLQEEFNYPTGMASDSSGNIYVADKMNHCLKKYSPTGDLIWQLGYLGKKDGEFSHPTDICVDVNGNVYAIDLVNKRVQKFNSAGKYIKEWGASGPGNKSFNMPLGIACDNSHIYVCDTGNDRIQKFDLSGEFLTQWGESGNTPGKLDRPTGIAVHNGNVFVVDSGNNRIQKFSLDGAPQGNWGTIPPGALNLSSPSYMAFSPSGDGYVTDTNCHRVVVFDSNGAFKLSFGGKGTAFGKFDEPRGLAFSGNDVWIADYTNHRLQKLDASGTHLHILGGFTHQIDLEASGAMSGNGEGEFDTPNAIAVDSKNRWLLVSDSGNNRIQYLNLATDNHVKHWNLPTASVAGIAVDPRGEVYYSDSSAVQVTRATPFNGDGSSKPEGNTPDLVGTSWTNKNDVSHMSGPSYVLVAKDNKLWVSDTQNDRILIFQRLPDFSYQQLQIIDGIKKPIGITQGDDGSVFVVASESAIVHRFDAGGTSVGSFGDPQGAAFKNPLGIAAVMRTEQLLYIADTGNSRVQVCKPNGLFVKALTIPAGKPAFKKPEDVAVDSRGNIYVLDSEAKTIILFDKNDVYVDQYNVPTPCVPVGKKAEPCGIWVDEEDKLIITDRVQNAVLRTETKGDLINYWNLECFLRMNVSPRELFYPELARQIVLDAPNHAVLTSNGLLIVADTNQNRVRIVRTRTCINANLTDLDEEYPDLSFRVETKGDWKKELGLEVSVGDVSIFDDSHDYIGEPKDSFSEDTYKDGKVLGATKHTNAAINTMKVVRWVQKWYQHNTRTADENLRWGTENNKRSLDIDINGIEGSCYFIDVNLDDDTTKGRGVDAWDDGIVAHEMSHWVFHKAINRSPSYSLWGLIQLSFKHSQSAINSYNQALTEGWAEYADLFFGGVYNPVDRIRGFNLHYSLNYISEDTSDYSSYEYIVGGKSSDSTPTFSEPGKCLKCEGLVANALYQFHHVLTNPSIVFSDSSDYWHRFNSVMTDNQATRYANTIWQALQMFEANAPTSDMDKGSVVYLRNLLKCTHSLTDKTDGHPGYAQMLQSIYELNNLLMPSVKLYEVEEDNSLGSEIDDGDDVDVNTNVLKQFCIKVKNVAGFALSGYCICVSVEDTSRFQWVGAGSGPDVHHGRRLLGWQQRATDNNGEIRFTYTGHASEDKEENLTLLYQPNFDTDATFSLPQKDDDRETTLRQLYLNELRLIAKTWGGRFNNFGAQVRLSITVET